MNKILIALLALVALIFGSTYLMHSNNVASAKISIEEKNNSNRKTFLAQKNEHLESFTAQYPENKNLFEDYFDVEKARFQKDTLIHFFVYSTKLPLTKYDSDYYDCLVTKCEAEVQNTKMEADINTKLKKLERRYGQLVNEWYEKIGQEKFANPSFTVENCKAFYKYIYTGSINKTAFEEFLAFLKKYKKDERSIKRKSEQAASNYNRAVRSARNSLTSTGRKMLSKKIESVSLITDINSSESYTGEILGTINYSFQAKEFEKSRLNSILDEVYLEQYKDNSLRNGATPYAYCFGSSNSCDSYNCSQIKVRTPYNSDVLVTIKRYGDVFRHAYIRAGNSYTFDFPNGTYQAFFYYGKGWNPNKFMKNTSCGKLKGGFISNEHFGKDSPQSLTNQILSYELILQQNGNFSTKPSNKDEAF